MGKKQLYIPSVMIQVGRYAQLFRQLKQDVREQVLIKMESLIRKEQLLCDQGNYGHLCNIFSAISLYEILQKQGKSKEEAYKIISEAMWKELEKTKKLYQKMARIPGAFSVFKRLLPSMFAKGSGRGWKHVWFPNKHNELYFEVKSCIYAQLFKKYGVPELGTMFCHSDEINFGQLHNIQFIRNGTLCNGDEKCDFLFVKGKI